MRIQILLSVSYLFRELSQRTENPYGPLPVKPQHAPYITQHREFYDSIFCHAQVGCRGKRRKSKGEGGRGRKRKGEGGRVRESKGEGGRGRKREEE
jgi:hypothetical protein